MQVNDDGPTTEAEKVKTEKMNLNLTALAHEGDMVLMAASGCASSARRICDLLAMRGYANEDELDAAERARTMFAMGAVQMDRFIRRLAAENARATTEEKAAD